jgi:uncharacterized membrane protein
MSNMDKDTAIKIIMGISIAGMLFSGYLTYTEVFAHFCGAAKLGLGSCTNVFKVPACVYGFFMYTIILIISIIGLKAKK